MRFAMGMLVGVSWLAATGQAPNPFRIVGTVVNDRNGEPVPFCHVGAALIAAARAVGPRGGEEQGGFDRGPGFRQQASETDADARGRFALEVPSEGRYRLNANARGFRVQNFEAHGTFSTAVVLTKAAPAHSVVFRISSDAVMSGEVRDDAGEAVREAQVKLYVMGDAGRAPGERRLQMTTVATTDDRGHYELPAMAAGSYKMSVSARPWYATPTPAAQVLNGAAAPALDPSLDVVYPTTWYPGADDEANGETIEVKYGEKRQLDFRLNPVAAARLQMTMPTQQPAASAAGGTGTTRNVLQRMPQLEEMMPDGTTEPVRGNMNVFGRDGHVDVGGLAPGTYRLAEPGGSSDGTQRYSVLHITAGGVVEGESAGVPEIPVTIRVDGDPTVTSTQVSLVDAATGQAVGRGGGGGRGGQGMGGPGGGQGGDRGRRGGNGAADEATLQVQPGTYEVVVNGRDSFLTGVTATGAQVTGRMVKIADGSPKLLVHMAAGMATIEGTANRLGKPSSGAMVLLVPATLGDPSSLGFERRAQTATDGSFQFTSVIPGQYILLAIDHGWGVNWRDASTLRPYLLQGEPLDLAAAATVHPVVKAVAP